MTETLIDLLRHGEPVGGMDRFRGVTDDPLSAEGVAQMRAALGRIRPWTHIYTSPMSRCRGFAETLGSRAGIPVTAMPGLRSWNLGDWEGHKVASIAGEAVGRFQRDPLRHAPPGAEDLEAVARRSRRACRAMLAAHPGGHVLAVTHSSVMRVLIATVLRMPLSAVFSLEMPPATMARLRFVSGRGALVFLRPTASGALRAVRRLH
jgi:broad specificity phosphatase PhoE